MAWINIIGSKCPKTETDPSFTINFIIAYFMDAFLVAGLVKIFRCMICNPALTVRFDRGYGPGVVRSKNSVIQGQWNRVRLHCNSWNGYVQLNDGPTAKGKPKVCQPWCKLTEVWGCIAGCSMILYNSPKFCCHCHTDSISYSLIVCIY